MKHLYLDIDAFLVHLIAAQELDDDYWAWAKEEAKKLQGEPLKKRFVFIPNGRGNFINGYVATDIQDQKPLYDRKNKYMRWNLRDQVASSPRSRTEQHDAPDVDDGDSDE